MYLWLTIISIIILIFLYPIRVHIYSEEGIKAYVNIFGFINIRVNYFKLLKKVVTRKGQRSKEEPANEVIEEDFNIIETIENIKKLISARPLMNDLLAKSNVNELNWYSAIPMDNPLMGLSMLPIYTTAQTIVIDYVYDHFNKVKDYDIDTKYNYLTDDVLIYFNCIISLNLLKIMMVSFKYIRKWPLLLKRIT
jgi:hypothetical protein